MAFEVSIWNPLQSCQNKTIHFSERNLSKPRAPKLTLAVRRWEIKKVSFCWLLLWEGERKKYLLVDRGCEKVKERSIFWLTVTRTRYPKCQALRRRVRKWTTACLKTILFYLYGTSSSPFRNTLVTDVPKQNPTESVKSTFNWQEDYSPTKMKKFETNNQIKWNSTTSALTNFISRKWATTFKSTAIATNRTAHSKSNR